MQRRGLLKMLLAAVGGLVGGPRVTPSLPHFSSRPHSHMLVYSQHDLFVTARHYPWIRLRATAVGGAGQGLHIALQAADERGTAWHDVAQAELFHSGEVVMRVPSVGVYRMKILVSGIAPEWDIERLREA